ncbi:hypothetical protein K501DRAFT_287075 [Backusella circina FSU 941]|nr:hypothetical protein K501DRAFT_287075 [Backusella circina FSU 941]
MSLLNPTKFGSSLFPSQKINPQLTIDSLVSKRIPNSDHSMLCNTYSRIRNRPNMQFFHISSSLSALTIQTL